MKTYKKLAIPLGVGAFLLFGIGTAPAQEQAPPRIDSDEVAERLGLTEDVRSQIVPELERLNGLVAQRAESAESIEKRAKLRSEFADARAKIAALLTPEQRRQLATIFHAAWGAQACGFGQPAAMRGMAGRPGHMAGPRGAGMMGGRHRMGGPGAGCGMHPAGGQRGPMRGPRGPMGGPPVPNPSN